MPLKSLTTLWVAIASTFPETNRMSLAHISKCVTSLSFLTKLLPNMGKILDLSLSMGELQSFKGVCKTKKNKPWPIFLQEYFIIIFDDNGYIRQDVDSTVIRKLRTLLYLFYKYEVPFTEDQILAAHQKFIDTDNSVADVTDGDVEQVRSLIGNILESIDPLAIRGHHSSGATAGGFNNIERRTTFQIIPSLNRVYDLKYFFNSHAHYKWHADQSVVEVTEPHSRVAFVPKDSRGPRTICIEPHTRMYMQQGLMDELYLTIESHPLTKGELTLLISVSMVNWHLVPHLINLMQPLISRMHPISFPGN